MNPQRLYQEMIEAADEYVVAKEAADLAEHKMEATKALCFKAQDEGSVEYRKAMVQLDERYEAAVVKHIQARGKELRAKLEWQALVTKIELMRTLESTRRQEMRLAGMS